ncbi:CCN family member 5-like isoform X1 [Amphibalanus amphitrite]|uniref:CCN family member 5-like isoform X1 n=1 Tax=Amphibalanus amphitrite TaxID=1232801 RepID=UPI001C921D66|nr:CCN family member 5-like isoform X1 [Amphibalanus amphitrite]
MRETLIYGWMIWLCCVTIATGKQKTECRQPCGRCRAEVSCQEGVPLVLDGCRCCPICARQHGQRCDAVRICDVTKQLVCDVTGTCRGSNFRSCLVNGTTYRDGQTFFTDCRTRCTCQDGSYACTSLCPQEMIRPSQRCKAPRLAEVRGQCCRQWTCAGDAPTSPAPCEPLTSDWSPCSATCGAGVSTRITNQNRDCTLRKESRLCQIRECPRHGDISWKEALFKMIREDQKVCHPTQRSPEAVHLQWQNCTSVHRHRPNFCTTCQHQCCRPVATFTRSLAFLCDLDRLPSGGDHLWRLGDGSRRPPEAGTHMATVTQKVMWIKECSCGPCESLPQEEGAVEGGGVRSENGGEEDAWSKSWEGAKAQEFMGGDIDGEEAL